MNDAEQRELEDLGNKDRDRLPQEFFAFYESVDSLVKAGRLSPPARTRGGEPWRSRIGPAILVQLRLYLCTSDKQYADVRAKGKSLAQSAVPAIAAYIAGAFGVTAGAASAAVAFVALAITRVGVGTFCELTKPGKKSGK